MTIETNRQHDLRELGDLIIADIRNTIERSTRTCLNCEHFSTDNEVCQLAGKRPPAKVIAFGCERFCEEIPF